MKKFAKTLGNQINLPLLDLVESPTIPAEKQKELSRSLMELLLQVAQENFQMSRDGGEDDEPLQAHA